MTGGSQSPGKDAPCNTIDDLANNKDGVDNGSKTHSILKSSQVSEASQRSEMQLPSSLPLPSRFFGRSDVSEGNNTTSRISSMILHNNNKVNRRVSFAPDVTLHSFEQVPEKMSFIREPRRKVNEPIVTSTQNDGSVESHEADHSLMELTAPVGMQAPKSLKDDTANYDGSQNYVPVFSQEDTMDITQLFSKHAKDDSTEENMDLTTIQKMPKSHTGEDITMELTEINTGNNELIEKKDLKEIIGKEENMTKTPQKQDNSGLLQPKRRKLNWNNDYESPTANRKSTTGTFGKELEAGEKETEEEDMELTVNERMSPVKVPGISSTIENDQKGEVRKTYSLDDFLEETAVLFLIDTNLIENRNTSINFKLTCLDNTRNMRINQLYASLYVQTPILEMNAFICKELLRRISQSKAQFEDLNRQMSSAVPPPLLLSEYFNSSEEVKQLITQQVHLVKSYSKLEAKKSWFQWRFQHLNGIKAVLLENLSILKAEFERIRSELSRIQTIKGKTHKLRDSIRQEIKLLKELPTDVYVSETKLEDKIQIESLRQKLKSNSVAIDNSKNLLDELNHIKEEIPRVTYQLMSVKREIMDLQSKELKEPQKKYLSNLQLNRMEAQLLMLGSISGLRFVKFHGSNLTIEMPQITPTLEITLLLQAVRENNVPFITFSEPYREDDFYMDSFRHLMMKDKGESPKISLDQIFITLRKEMLLISEYIMLKMVFPVHIVKRGGNKEPYLRIEDYDINGNRRVTYELSLENFSEAILDWKSEIHISAFVEDSHHGAFSDLSSQFFRKATKIIPWIDHNRCKILFTEAKSS